MSVTAIITPIKSHGGLFSTCAAGGRNLFKSSPLSKVNNPPPFTPPRIRAQDPEWHAEKKNTRFQEACTSRDNGALFQNFYTPKKSKPLPPPSPLRKYNNASPKSNITNATLSPHRAGILGPNKWTLNPVNNKNAATTSFTEMADARWKLRNTKPKKNWDTHRDRFIPNRNASGGTCLLKIHQMQTREKKYNTGGKIQEEEGVFQGRVFGTNHGVVDVKSPGCDFDEPNLADLRTQATLADALSIDLGRRIFEFVPQAPPKPVDMRVQYNRPLVSEATNEVRRHILNAPERVLDAPGVLNDPSINPIDWSSGNRVVIALGSEVHTWNATTNSAELFAVSNGNTYNSSVKFADGAETLAIGDSTGKVHIWNVEKKTKIRTLNCHNSRVGIIAWSSLDTLSTGSGSGSIWNHDLRQRAHRIAELVGHRAEVAGLEWRSDGRLLASGGNDRVVNIWDARSLIAPKFTKTEHHGTVKALAWSPWKLNCLATGGGWDDNKIHFWNTANGSRFNTIHTDAPVSSLHWSTSFREIVSTHGGPYNELTVWEYPSLNRKHLIPAHDNPILCSALSPDGSTLATLSADENLKFWNLFTKKQTKKKTTAIAARDFSFSPGASLR